MMNKRTAKKAGIASPSNDSASLQDLQPIILLKPEFDLEESARKAFQQRRTIREISDRKLPLQTLSNLLWVAYGVNRKDGPFGIPGRTAASASNSQEIDLYVAMEEGTYLYDAIHHKLVPVVAGDLRTFAIGHGQTGFGDKAPVRLIYVADIHKLSHTSGYQEPGLQDAEIQKSYYFVDTGMIAANVYLYAASQDLAAWFHNCDKPELTTKLALRTDQRVLFGQTVGYPANK
jgi:hypothetical protein